MVSSTVTGPLTVVVSLPSGMQKLTCLCGRPWVWSGEWALSSWEAFASGQGLRTLPNFPPTVRNGPYVDSWNAFFAGCQTSSCGGHCFDYGYVIFLWACYSIYLNHFVRQWWSPSSFGRLPTKQPGKNGGGDSPLALSVKSSILSGDVCLHNLSRREQRISLIAILHRAAPQVGNPGALFKR